MGSKIQRTVHWSLPGTHIPPYILYTTSSPVLVVVVVVVVVGGRGIKGNILPITEVYATLGLGSGQGR
jgi:hypothetical protein